MLSLLLAVVILLGILPATPMTVFAAATHYVGAEYTRHEDDHTNDYTSNSNEYYWFSDESAILING